MGRTDPSGNVLPGQYTATGHLNNHFSVGPAILWSPFLITAHLAVLPYDALGGHVPADGYSEPYVLAMAAGTALYGFLAIWISFRLARKYLPERWAFLAALGIWFASSLPVYMYFNPSWSHAHSAFMVALFALVLGSHSRNPHLVPVGNPRCDRRADDGCLLPERASTPLSVCSSRSSPIWKAFRKSQRQYRALGCLGTTSVWCRNLCGVSSHTNHEENHLRKLHKFWLHRALVLEFTGLLIKVCFSAEHGLFSWTPVVPRGCRDVFASKVRSIARTLLD